MKTQTSTGEQKELRASNKQELEAICAWINNNIDKHIGWDELSQHTKRSHKDLIDLFKQINTTPMAYIRYVKDTVKLKEEIKTKTAKIINEIKSPGTDIPLKRSQLITQNRIAAQEQSNVKEHSRESKKILQSDSAHKLTNASNIYKLRKEQIKLQIQSIDPSVKVSLDNDMDMHESNSHIVTLKKGLDIRTVGLSKDEFFNIGDQFNISALLRILTSINEMKTTHKREQG